MDPFSFEGRILSQRGIQYIIAEINSSYRFHGNKEMGENEIAQLFQETISSAIQRAPFSSDSDCSKLMHALQEKAQDIFLGILEKLGEEPSYPLEGCDPIARYNRINLAMHEVISSSCAEYDLRARIEANKETFAGLRKIAFIWAVNSFWRHMF